MPESSDGEFQTRDLDGQVYFWDTLKEAMASADADDSTVWKVSFSIGHERVRLVRDVDSLIDGSRTSWVYEPITLEVLDYVTTS